MRDNGGQVHPHLHIKHSIAAHNNIAVPVYEIKDGMTMLDHFAGLAMNGHLSRGRPNRNKGRSIRALARSSYEIAKEMIAERKRLENINA